MPVVFAASAVAVLAVMGVAYLAGRALGRHNVVDTAWGLAFVAVAGVAAVCGHAPVRWLLLALVATWGLRLATHLAWRSRGHGEDPRYEALLERAGGNREVAVLVRVYLVQAVLVWIVALPVQLAAWNSATSVPLVVAGSVVWLGGFGFEAVGDRQLARFKADPANRGRVMDRGLWRLTRHPNYFGDACLWWGLYIVAASGLPGALAMPSPVIMTLLVTKISGRDLLERHMAGRPGYAEYVARTSSFLPRRPKNARAAA